MPMDLFHTNCCFFALRRYSIPEHWMSLFINPFVHNAHFLYPLFSWDREKDALGTNGLSIMRACGVSAGLIQLVLVGTIS